MADLSQRIRVFICFTVVLAVLAAAPVTAGETTLLAEKSKISKSTASPHSIDLGFMFYRFDYEEDLTPPKKSEEEAWLPGFYAGYTYQPENSIYLRIYGEYTSADTDYDGSDQSGTPIKDTTGNEFWRSQFEIGYTFKEDAPITTTLYTGYGYRYWERKLGGSSPYREEYSWHYIPVGTKINYQINDTWSAGINVAAHFMFEGKIKIHMSDIDPSDSDPRLDLGNKTGWRAELPVQYKLTIDWAITASPWYEYSAIGRSNTESYTSGWTVTEPASRTHQCGIKTGIAYIF